VKLYITPASPVRTHGAIVVIEKALQSRVEIFPAQTRLTDSPYYDQPIGSRPVSHPRWGDTHLEVVYMNHSSLSSRSVSIAPL
jgi:hypothetical protein